MGCIYVVEAVIWGKVMRVCTHKHDNSGSGIIILHKCRRGSYTGKRNEDLSHKGDKENRVEIGLIIAEILLFIKSYRDLHFQDQLMLYFYCQRQLDHFVKDWLKSIV